MLHTKPGAGKNLKDGRREKVQHKSLCELFPQRLTVILVPFLVHEQTEVELLVIQQQNFQILVWVKEGKK